MVVQRESSYEESGRGEGASAIVREEGRRRKGRGAVQEEHRRVEALEGTWRKKRRAQSRGLPRHLRKKGLGG